MDQQDEPIPNPSPAMFALISIGASALFFLPQILILADPHHRVLYHMFGRPSTVFIPVIFDIPLLALIFYIPVVACSSHPRLRRILLAALLCIAAMAVYWDFVNSFPALSHYLPARKTAAAIMICFGLFLLLVFAGVPLADEIFLRAWAIARAVLSITGFVAIVTLLQLIWFCWQARDLNTGLGSSGIVSRPVLSTNASRGRVIWIVMDELAYEQLNGDRLPGLELPNFDRLSSESSDLQQVIPAGTSTEDVMLSLMTGSEVQDVWLSPDGGRFWLVAKGQKRYFDQKDTVFRDARQLGYANGVVGWYMPYCRMLQGELASCTWSFRRSLGGVEPSASLLTAVLHPFVATASKAWVRLVHPHKMSTSDLQGGIDRTRDFVDLSRDTDAALADHRITFLLIHLPLPHPEGIWDRHTNQFAIARSSYVDNLALADITLGHIRSQLEAAGEWDADTVLVIGDHGWRTRTIWANDPAWSADDQQASHGRQYDPRPAYLLKLPNQHQPVKIGASFNALRTRALLDAMLRRQFASPDQLQTWIETQPAPRSQFSSYALPQANSASH
jgi:hypothetical protein